jgi:hypothetical protein
MALDIEGDNLFFVNMGEKCNEIYINPCCKLLATPTVTRESETTTITEKKNFADKFGSVVRKSLIFNRFFCLTNIDDGKKKVNEDRNI